MPTPATLWVWHTAQVENGRGWVGNHKGTGPCSGQPKKKNQNPQLWSSYQLVMCGFLRLSSQKFGNEKHRCGGKRNRKKQDVTHWIAQSGGEKHQREDVSRFSGGPKLTNPVKCVYYLVHLCVPERRVSVHQNQLTHIYIIDMNATKETGRQIHFDTNCPWLLAIRQKPHPVQALSARWYSFLQRDEHLSWKWGCRCFLCKKTPV